MVIGHHLIWTAYGWWLPNDPRGSTSNLIRSEIIAELGELHHGRKRIQPCAPIVREFHARSGPVLKHVMLEFQQDQFAIIASGLNRALEQRRYTCWALAIMPDHVHICVRKHRDSAEEMLVHLQRESHLACREHKIRDLEHPVWGGPGWKVFLDSPEDVIRTCRYINDNPLKVRLPGQHWQFVDEYDNWPYHRKLRP